MSRMDESTVLQLSMIVEDAGRVQNTIGKALRSGLGATDMCHGRSNRDLLLQDLEMLRSQIVSAERVLRGSEQTLPLGGPRRHDYAGPDPAELERRVDHWRAQAAETGKQPKPASLYEETVAEVVAEEDKRALGGG